MMYWFELPFVGKLPFLYRFFSTWCRYGIRRSNGTVWAGNRLFSLLFRLEKLIARRSEYFHTTLAANDGFFLTINLMDFECFQHTMPLSAGKSSEMLLVDCLLPFSQGFLDIGANYGVFSLFACARAPHCQVFAFEAQEKLCRAIQMARTANKFENLSVVHLALGDREEMVDFFVPDSGSGVGSLFFDNASRFSKAHGVPVHMTTLDHALEKTGIGNVDLVKIDVEGVETEVVIGASETINRYRPVILFEFNPRTHENAKSSVDSIFHALRRLGYQNFYEVSSLLANGLERSNPFSSNGQLANCVAVPAERHEFLRKALEKQ